MKIVLSECILSFVTKLIIFALEGLYSKSEIRLISSIIYLLQLTEIIKVKNIKEVFNNFGEKIIRYLKNMITSFENVQRAQNPVFL